MTIPAKLIMTLRNDQQILITGLFDKGTGSYFNNTATITATLKDWHGNTVPGCVAIPLTYVASSNGNFVGAVTETFAPAIGGGYTLIITASQGAANAQWVIPVEVKFRSN